MKKNVLVVDDTPDNLAHMSALLKEQYIVRVAKSGARALEIASSERPPDLILLDIMMPVMDGYEVCRRLKSDPTTASIPVIFLTGRSETEDEAYGLELGASDYIVRPFHPSIALARVRTQLQLKGVTDLLRDQNSYLEREVQARTNELTALQEVTIHSLASLAETRDSDTGNHIRRTKHFVLLLAEKLRNHPDYRDYLDAKTIDSLYKSAPLHDIGKVGIPDRILMKPGRFEPHEFEIMKTHTTLGRDALIRAEQELGLDVPFLRYAKEIAYTHHEKWDGSGYPEGLKETEIPISGRLMAVADVYDALVSRRVYKEAMPHSKAVEIIEKGRGSHFDPRLVDAFLELQDEFLAVTTRFRDSDEELQNKAKDMSIYE